MTCLMIAYVLRRSCFVGGNFLCKVMCWWSACLYDGISYYIFCYTGRHFLLDDMFYLRVCIMGGHVLQFKLFHWNTCFTGGHILLDNSS